MARISTFDQGQAFRSLDEAAGRFTRGLALVLLAISSLKLLMLAQNGIDVAATPRDYLVGASCLISLVYSSVWALGQFLASYFSLRELAVQIFGPKVPAGLSLLVGCGMVIFSSTVSIAVASAIFSYWPG